jgi:uncharacterized protein involved in exopolysaccharide biosynthesis
MEQPMSDRMQDRSSFERSMELSSGLVGLPALWRKKWHLLASMSLVMGLGIVYLALVSPIYESAARVLVHRNSALGQKSPSRDDEQFLATQAEIISSPKTIERALKSVPQLAVAELGLDPVSRVMRSLDVTPITGTNVLSIGIRQTDPNLANELINAVIQSYVDYVRELEHIENSESVRVLASSEQQINEELKSLWSKYLSNRERSPLVGDGNQAMAYRMSRLRTLGDALDKSKHRRLDIEHKLEVSLTGKPVTLPKIMAADPSIFGVGRLVSFEREYATVNADNLLTLEPEQAAFKPEPQNVLEPSNVGVLANANHDATSDPAEIERKLLTAQTELHKIDQVYGPKHPQARALSQEIDWLTKLLRESQARLAATSEQEVTAMKMTEVDLSKEYQKELDQLKALDSHRLEEQFLVDRISKLDDVHQATLTTLSQAQLTDRALAEGHSSISVSVLEAPQLPESPVWPQPAMFLSVCAMVGLLLGGLVVIVLENRALFVAAITGQPTS